MPPRSVSFDDDDPYLGNRPHVDLILFCPAGPVQIKNALVDTGADYTQVDLGVASQAGLAPHQQGVPISLATAGGAVSAYLMRVTVEVLGHQVGMQVCFAPNANPLLGRQGIFSVMDDVGFTPGDWLQKW